jgi:hypothetical protein
VVLQVLNLYEYSKIQATNAMKQAFPACYVQRKGKSVNRVNIYHNVSLKCSFTTCTRESSLSVDESSDIANIKKLISDITAQLGSVSQRL